VNVNIYNCVNTSMTSIPLKVRKALKDETLPQIAAELAKCSEVLGVTLSFIDNTPDIFTALQDKGDATAEVIAYFTQLTAMINEVAANPVAKEALAAALRNAGGKIGVKVFPSDPGSYFVFSADALWITVNYDYWNLWVTHHDAEQLEKALPAEESGSGSVPLVTKKTIAVLKPELDAAIAAASAAYGAPITFEVDYGYAWKWWGKDDGQAAELANSVCNYAKQFSEVFVAFVANADNKEAVQEKFTTNTVGFLWDKDGSDDRYWVWQDGKLLLQVNPSYFGSWLSYYDAEKLESTL